MCTVTWWKQPSSYELFFNRDELKTRQPALPPKVFRRSGVRYIAPLDGDFFGSWIFVNEYGLTACLLNQYPKNLSRAEGEPVSRGLLLRSLADCSDLDTLNKRLCTVNLSSYRPFLLVGLELKQPARLWDWDSYRLNCDTHADAALPITTSSFASSAVADERKHYFRQQLEAGKILDPDFLENYHQAHFPGRSAFSVCMMRDDAETVSLSRARVSSEGILFTYCPRIPGPPFWGKPIRLTLETVQILC